MSKRAAPSEMDSEQTKRARVESTPALKFQRTVLTAGSMLDVGYISVTPEKVKELVDFMLQLSRMSVNHYGTTRPQKRLQYCIGTKPQKYLGHIHPREKPIPALCNDFMEMVQKLEPGANSIRCNAFVNGHDSFAAHSDNTGDLKHLSRIYMLSVGGKRDFELVKLKTCKDPNAVNHFTVRMISGTVIVMDQNTQETHTHGVPAVKERPEDVLPRVSIVIRAISDPSTWTKSTPCH